MLLEKPVTVLRQVGKKRAEDLLKAGIRTLGDLARYFPRQGHYIDYGRLTPINSLKSGARQIFRGRVVSVLEKRSARGVKYALLRVGDGTGYAQMYFFGAQIYKARKFSKDTPIVVSGRVEDDRNSQAKLISGAVIEADDPLAEEKPVIMPVYGLSGELTQNMMRAFTKQLTELLPGAPLPDPLPAELREKYGFLDLPAALKNIHYPDDRKTLDLARRRLAFEELYLMQCALLFYRGRVKNDRKGYKHGRSGAKVAKVLDSLPFVLTKEQAKAWREIEDDMEDAAPMHRLLQGDVGSGKTAVAVLALAKAAENGFQGALMVPTEILAQQHFTTLTGMFQASALTVGLLTGHTAAAERRDLLEALRLGSLDVIVGTHALLQEKVVFKDLSLVVTDEQHRFGVRQRAGLTEKSAARPDVLVMTATPIPRTMALTVYGDLDVSFIRELPPGRKPVLTLCYDERKRREVYKGLVRQIGLGRQAYVVCPLIEESEKIDALSAVSLFEELKSDFLRDIPAALLHGRMKSAEKDEIMRDFTQGEIKVLVSTTVIEVGINVPNATLMIIEGAERFGLAQLHQLRGRIGRGAQQSYCALLSGPGATKETMDRLRLMVSHSDGFRLAEEDLRLRGSGELFGARQHGLPDLRLADIFSDADLLLMARDGAKKSMADEQTAREIIRYVKTIGKEDFAAILSD
jgi:ATP-dependent DNA helicase RecG